MLQGINIILRPLKLSDWERTIEWRNSLSIKNMAMMHPFPITELNEKDWYAGMVGSTDNSTVYFTITGKDDKPLGFISLRKINYINRNCHLGIVIGESTDRGRGYGREAMELILNYAFKTLNLHKVTVEVLCGNDHAIGLYKKLGFVEEGILRQQYFCCGEYMDVMLLSAFSSDSGQ